MDSQTKVTVHGDIRHLEMIYLAVQHERPVHGDIRHLEICQLEFIACCNVHGDIRHLENFVDWCLKL